MLSARPFLKCKPPLSSLSSLIPSISTIMLLGFRPAPWRTWWHLRWRERQETERIDIGPDGGTGSIADPRTPESCGQTELPIVQRGNFTSCQIPPHRPHRPAMDPIASWLSKVTFSPLWKPW
jgi:hypothetical protein